MKILSLISIPLVGFSSIASGENDRRTDYTVAGSLVSEQGKQDREILDMNRGWRVLKASKAPEGFTASKFDDQSWDIVNLPHGTDLLPEEASGCMNYQGPIFYRKSFEAPESLKGKKLSLYFEGIMGKSKIWVNGVLVKEHLGGYLPIIADVTNDIHLGKMNTIVIEADNSNDPSFPPGKPQETLDFAYFGGAYRDAYLIATNPIHITDANASDTVAGGGVFFRTESYDPSTKEAKLGAKVQVANDTKKTQQLDVVVSLELPGKSPSVTANKLMKVDAGQKAEVDLAMMLKNPELWSPKAPHLYHLVVEVRQAGTSEIYDRQVIPVGIRTLSFGQQGFSLNGKPYEGKLMGVNRHQDFAVLGNAVPNNLQWQDAVKLKKAGMEVVRCAHYPMDPAFMDACDRLGLFVIVATPGWQFWGTGNFAELVYKDIRNMVRRDRNHPSVLLWEPILNETHYPSDFAKKTHDAVKEEFPYQGNTTACDSIAKGVEHFDVIYGHPMNQKITDTHTQEIGSKPYFTREYGDNVDDWSSHNSSSRVARAWGEQPMLKQAIHYLKPPYIYTCVDTINKAPDYHFGGALWHPFDHQRGYHPDPFYGGIMDAFRQPKTSYYGFMSQRPLESGHPDASGPMVYVAHEGSPFSPEDITVFSNCDEVKLFVPGKEPMVLKPEKEERGIQHPPLVFKKAWDFQDYKQRNRGGENYKIIAEGWVDGVCKTKHEISPSKRTAKIQLRLDNDNLVPQANGSDTFVVVAEMVDGRGYIKRLNNEQIVFTVEGPAQLVGDESISANPKNITWGTAPVLVRMGETPGKVKVKAQVKHPGSQKPISGELEFVTVPSSLVSLQKDTARATSSSQKQEKVQSSAQVDELKKQLEKTQSELNQLRNKEVERQQQEFQ